MKPVRMVVFDLDGTLIEGKSSWGRVHEFFGTEQKGDDGLGKYERGEINYVEFMKRDASAWPAGISRSVLEKILSGFTFSKGAQECTSGLRKRGLKMGVVSSGLDILANMVCHDLGIECCVANGLVFDQQDRLTSDVLPRVDLLRKDEALIGMASEQGLKLEEMLGVGDTRFDITLLRACGYRVAFRPRNSDRSKLEEIAHYFVDDLKELLPIVDIINKSSTAEQKQQNRKES
jgi:phosphoserine phosphatase